MKGTAPLEVSRHRQVSLQREAFFLTIDLHDNIFTTSSLLIGASHSIRFQTGRALISVFQGATKWTISGRIFSKDSGEAVSEVLVPFLGTTGFGSVFGGGGKATAPQNIIVTFY